PLTDWADGPGAPDAQDLADGEDGPGNGLPVADDAEADGLLPRPSFGLDGGIEPGAGEGWTDQAGNDEYDYDDDSEDPDEGDEGEDESDSAYGSLLKMPLELSAPANRHPPIDLSAEYPEPAEEPSISVPELDPGQMELGDWLASAREMAEAARNSEDRTRGALYGAIGLAYDFALAADEAPSEFGELLADAGLKAQDRAPMTPVVKLVFGAAYDKTRVTEYATALTHARRIGLPRGALGEFLSRAEGGLKGVVQTERRLRKEEAGKPVGPADGPREVLARKLRALPAQDFAAIPAEGSEFALVMIRRTGDGAVEVLGETSEDVPLVERAGRRLVG